MGYTHHTYRKESQQHECQNTQCTGKQFTEERREFDRFVDPNVRGAQRRVYSDLRIYRN